MSTLSSSTFDMTDDGALDSGDSEGPRALSVAEIQQLLREAQGRRSRLAARRRQGPPAQAPGHAGTQRIACEGEQGRSARRPSPGESSTPAPVGGDVVGETQFRWGDGAGRTWQGGGDIGELPAGGIAVLAGHSGAGASTVALTLSDAAAAQGRRVHLVDSAGSMRSGLAAAASEELGTDGTGAWRRGLRSGVVIDRRATATAGSALGGWPVPPVGDDPVLTVVDLGLLALEDLARLAVDGLGPVVVCRPTVPGVRLTEQVLDQLDWRSVVVAAVGPHRWPGEVISSLGSRLRALRAAGRVVPMPMDRRLQVTGATSSPLPRALGEAGRSLLECIDGSHQSAPTTVPGPTLKELRR